MTMAAVAVRFKRTEDSKWELGIAVMRDASVSDVAHIIDLNLNVLTSVYDYTLTHYRGSFTIIIADDARA